MSLPVPFVSNHHIFRKFFHFRIARNRIAVYLAFVVPMNYKIIPKNHNDTAVTQQNITYGHGLKFFSIFHSTIHFHLPDTQ